MVAPGCLAARAIEHGHRYDVGICCCSRFLFDGCSYSLGVGYYSPAVCVCVRVVVLRPRRVVRVMLRDVVCFVFGRVGSAPRDTVNG